MLVNFSIENFGPIKDKQTLSFEASSSKVLNEQYLLKNTGKYKILKLGMIYGSNASGKSTILLALDFFRNLVLEPASAKTQNLDFSPFLFDNESRFNNSKLFIDFIQSGIRYIYHIEFNKKAIVSEELLFHNPNKSRVFLRNTDLNSKYTTIEFGNKIKISRSYVDILSANTLWNNTVLGGYLKININQPELNNVLTWFENSLSTLVCPKTDLNSFITSKIKNDIISKHQVLSILRSADFDISNIVIDKGNDEILDDNTVGESLVSYHKLTKTKYDISFEHRINNTSYRLDFENESEGTKRYFGFAGLLSLALNQSTVLPIDELESSLHPDLFMHFILSFLLNSEHSQIIATTHNREILNDRDIFRDDAIWFTDKSDKCCTELYSLADFDSSVIRNTSNVFNAYKTGKLGAVPNLGDYYINPDTDE